MASRVSTKPDPSQNHKPEPVSFDFGANVTAPIETKTEAAPDPFDVERLRLPVEDADLGVKELLVSVPYKKPSKESFFRVHPDPTYRCVGGLIELKEDDSESFWIDRTLWPALSEEPTFGRRQLFTCVTRQGLVFLWGCRLPGPDGKKPDWVTIPLEAAASAQTRWTKIFWDNAQRRHRIKVSDPIDDEPKWPDKTLSELLRLAFKDRVIAEPDHPILQKLRGEV